MADIEVVYFTDPFCSWCWATEPALLALRERHRGHLSVRHVMGGLVRDMSDFHDVANGIRSTAEVAPHWREVAVRSGQPIDERVMLDITDPHWSTWPACVAVKAAELQGRGVGDRLLRRLRRAALTERAQAQRTDVQLRLAAEVTGLDVARFEADLGSAAAAEAFRRDRAECAAYGASGFPTMLFRLAGSTPAESGVLVGGHRSLEVYERVVDELAPGLVRQPPRSIAEVLSDHGPLTTRELAVITGDPQVRTTLAPELSAGTIDRVEVRGGELWARPNARA